jgi:hypothetical protein
MDSISVIKTSVDRAGSGRVNVSCGFLRGQSILLIGIFVVRNWESGISNNIYEYIYRYIVSTAVQRNPRMQLCHATKRGELDFGLSNFKWYILLKIHC